MQTVWNYVGICIFVNKFRVFASKCEKPGKFDEVEILTIFGIFIFSWKLLHVNQSSDHLDHKYKWLLLFYCKISLSFHQRWQHIILKVNYIDIQGATYVSHMLDQT